MLIAGVICEYNPFHRGHEYQLRRIRESLGEDTAVVCVMGGDFVQRGEPAVAGKHSRARMAVLGGADLVVELPAPWSVASAERFAAGGVALLDAMCADVIAFGAECPDAGRLSAIASALLTPEAGALIKKRLLTGVSYAAARESAISELIGEDALLLREPNNILAVEYLKAIARRGSALRPLAVPRFAVGHDGGESGDFASASRIRELLFTGGDASRYMPEAAWGELEREIGAGRAPVDPADMEIPALYRLRTMTESEFMALPDAGEGLWARFARFSRSEPTLRAVLEGVKTKRYALSRLRRMAVCAVLGIGGEDQLSDPPYIRVLAGNGRGREALRRIKRLTALPIITKPAAARRLPEEPRRIFNLTARAADIYALLYPSPEARAGGGDWRQSPFMP